LQLPTRIQPYIFGGVGYNHMSVKIDNNPTLVLRQTEDNQVAIPAGGGVSAYATKHFTVDVRGTYRYIPDNEVTAMNTSALHQWLAQARVGYTF
jgi:opacity protein-like surface antigen